MKDFRKVLSVLFLLAVLSVLFMGADVPADYVMCASFGPVLWPAGADNMGGYKGRIAFIPETSVSVVPTLPKEAKATADFVTATGAFTFLESGGKPTPIYATRATVGYKAESQGETDCKSYKISGEFFHPGKKVEAAAFARQICNTPGYLIIEDNESQQLIGQPGYPCTVTASFDGGQGGGRQKRIGPSLSRPIAPPPMIIMGTPIDIDALFTGVAPTPPEGGS